MSENNLRRSRRTRQQVNYLSEYVDLSPVKKELEKELAGIDEEVQKSTILFDDKDVSGNCIYGFQTPVKKNAMTEKAKQSQTPRTPASVSKNLMSVRVLAEKIDELSPAKVRSAVKKRQDHFDSESESVTEGSEYEPSDSDGEEECNDDDTIDSDASNQSDVENNAVNVTPKKNQRVAKKIQTPITPCRRGKSKNNIVYRDYHLKTDEYFETQSEKALTSDHTLGKLKNPKMNEEKLQELLKDKNYISEKHLEGIQELLDSYRSLFPMWYRILEEGYSLLLHGLGSKRNLINDFHQEILSEHPTLVINGFFPSLTIKDILEGIITELLELECPSNINDCFTIIESTMKKNPDDRLYLLVHNIDGTMLRSNKSQDMLSRLAAIANVRMVATVDHINAPLLWDNVKRARYNFYWWDTTTLLPYEAETSYESSLLVQRSGALALSSLRNVFASLTTNAKAIYTILVKYQIENAKNTFYHGMAFKDLYRSARERFLVSSDIALRAQLTEFLDHKLVKTKRNVDGADLHAIYD
ncbi:Similar to Orc2: Origin recognition complex subunit 2 (Drosophila melanogaster) [Cotesia congregata]|uniref:Origin recognition complex subunit 2 n=1 Tax=Cotesia congregata TaxID=51543 RepID=A0A8J2MEY5_COTCN|nr:Similar to Orc2: Origin recognition complex subunit 2 (Drosophila melanogaster) [Cotesia congregata]